MSNKFNKFLALGLAAVTLANGFAAPTNANENFEYFKSHIEHNIETSFDAGLLTKDIHLHVKKVDVDHKDYTVLTKANNSMVSRADGTCDVHIGLSHDGHVLSLGHHKDVIDLASPQNLQQIKYNNEFIGLHESSHCEFKTILEPILVKGNTEVQKQINYFYKYSSSPDTNLDIYHAIGENFADVYSAIQMIKKHGINDDLLHVIKAKQFERHDLALFAGSKDSVRSHHTSFSLGEVLQPEMLKQIQATDNVDALKDLALSIANHGVHKAMNTNENGIHQAMNLENIITGTITAVHAIASQINTTLNHDMSKATHFEHEATAENSYIYKKAFEFIHKNGAAEFKTVDNKIEFTGDYNKLYDSVSVIVQEGLNSNLRKSMNTLKAEVKKTASVSELHQMNSKTSKEDYQVKRDELKKDFITYTGNLNKVENVALKSKTDIQGRIAQMRQAQTLTSTTKMTLN